MTENNKTAIILVAAGKGSRAGRTLPKQYALIGGKTLIRHTCDALRRTLSDSLIMLVITPDDEVLCKEALSGVDSIDITYGGQTRQESVFAGLKALEAHSPEYVLIHDAARPFVSSLLIQRLIETLKSGTQAVIPATAVTDTLKRAQNDIIIDTVDREGLYSVQTPQGFVYKAIYKAHTAAPHNEFTDDAAVFEASGKTVAICQGEESNFKVTRPEDFIRAEERFLLACPDVRTGSGFDVHQFEDGDAITLCGITLPFTKRLKGHSDADVGLHAITDALLAAICAGDIGTHFPPTEPKWKGTESHIFLAHAAHLVREKGGLISHVGVTLICEKPKVGPHKDAMRKAIAAILKLPISRVSVQATTTEKLGFTGREEGVAAQAITTIRLPLGED